MKKLSFSAAGGIITAVVASLCCIGPILVVLLGIGSISAFSVFDHFRPYLIGVTVLLLGLAFYFVYRERDVQCEDGTCKIKNAGKWNKIGVWSATFLAAIAIAFPYLGIAPSASANLAVQGKANVSLKVEGMDCNACAAGLEASLGRINGVHTVHVSFEKMEAVVEYDPALITPDDFVARVKENGLTATIIEQKKGN